MSITLRNALIHECWTPVSKKPEFTGPPHFPVQLWGVIEDKRFGDEPFADVVAYWPATDLWTATLQCRGSQEADDVPVRVILYQPLPPVPKVWP